MRTLSSSAEYTGNRVRREVIRKGIDPYRNGAARGDKMDLHCPNCNSTDLKKVSLACANTTDSNTFDNHKKLGVQPKSFSPTSVRFKGEINDALPRKRHPK